MANYKLDLIPNYITASTPKELRRLMLLNNIRLGVTARYFDVQNIKGTWYAWFYERDMKDVQKVLDGDS